SPLCGAGAGRRARPHRPNVASRGARLGRGTAAGLLAHDIAAVGPGNRPGGAAQPDLGIRGIHRPGAARQSPGTYARRRGATTNLREHQLATRRGDGGSHARHPRRLPGAVSGAGADPPTLAEYAMRRCLSLSRLLENAFGLGTLLLLLWPL